MTAPGQAAARPRLDGVALSGLFRPRILALVLVQAAAGFLLERPDDLAPLLPLLVAVGLTSAAGCALNHYLERDTDGRMARTAARPLVTGALAPPQVLALSLPLLVVGLAVAFVGCGPATGALLALAAALYLGVYTPLKRRTSTNTWVGAIPGALPLTAGAAAAGGPGMLAWIGFALVFLWQLPHFFAIASMYRDEYRAGGLRMLSGDDPDDASLRWQLPLQVMSVVLVSVLPLTLRAAGPVYAAAALAGGAGFLAAAVAFGRRPGRGAARRVVLVSVAYLPLVLGALVWDGRAPPAAPDPGALPVLGELPDFRLVADDGSPFARADLAGEVWVVDFVFTRCGNICVAMSREMAALQDDGVPARFLSVSIDPARDDPPTLRAYRERWDGDAATWTLLTGEPDAIRALAEEGFRLPADVGVEGMPPVFHSGKFALVDRAGRVRGYYDHDDRVEVDALRRDVRRLAADG